MIEHEHGHHHGHGTGVRWLDLTTTVAIVLISVISLVVSFEHGQTMRDLVDENRKMVAASTLPYLEVGQQNIDPVTGRKVAALVVENAGVGPALIDWLEVSYSGKPVANAADLFRACCHGHKHGALSNFYFSTASGRILPPKESIKAYWFDSKDPSQADLFQSFSAAQSKIQTRGCYCSVLEQCWLSEFGEDRPKPVASCKMKGVTPFR